MTDDRVREIARECAVSEPEYSDWENAIRLALAERDREIAEWVQANLVIKEHWGLQLVHADELLAFLKGEA